MVLSTKEPWYDLIFEKSTMAAVWRISSRGIRMVAGRAIAGY